MQRAKRIHPALWVLIAIAGFVMFSGLGCGALMFACQNFLKPRPEDVIAKDAHETAVKAADLGLHGTLLVDKINHLDVVDVETGDTSEVLPLKGDDTVFALAGPNRKGIAAVVVNNMMAKRHRLIRLDLATGEAETVFERKGDALWQDAIGESISVAADANVVLVHVGKGHTQLYDPQAYMASGELQIVNLDTGEVRAIAEDAFDTDTALSSTGAEAWFVRAYNRNRARSLPGGAQLTASNSRTPVVFHWSASGETPVAPGWGVRVSADEKTLVIEENGQSERLLSASGQSLEPTGLPDYTYGVAYIESNGIMVTTAQQIRTNDVQFTRNNGMPGPRPMARIVGFDAKTGRVANLYPAVDPRWDWSYGEWSQSLGKNR
ncbi:MAG TPA: hypothetical protein VNI20_08980 [Fimbriimonadaceae bacterium]|nr:hypothetical protein [Fimbriimonadaceae bacterium]